MIRRVDTCVVRSDKSQVVLPGEYVEISNHDLSKFDGEVAIEPRSDFPQSSIWPSPAISRVIRGTVRIPNMSEVPIKLSKSQHIAQLRRVTNLLSTSDSSTSSVLPMAEITK